MAMALALFFWAVAAITVGLFIGRVWWMPELISQHGALIDRQMVVTLIIAGTVFFLAQVGLGYFLWRYRARGAGQASYWHENSKLEFTWTIITAIVFIGLGIRGNQVWASYFLTDAPPGALTVEVTAQQFAWNIRYPGAGRQVRPDGPRHDQRFDRQLPRDSTRTMPRGATTSRRRTSWPFPSTAPCG